MQTADFFRSRIDAMINLNDPLAVLARRMPWAQIEAALAAKFEHVDRPGEVIEGHDLIGPYEFGVKNAVVVSHEHGLMLGARTFPGNPYDGHILSAVLEQARNITQNVSVVFKRVVVDRV